MKEEMDEFGFGILFFDESNERMRMRTRMRIIATSGLGRWNRTAGGWADG